MNLFNHIKCKPLHSNVDQLATLVACMDITFLVIVKLLAAYIASWLPLLLYLF